MAKRIVLLMVEPPLPFGNAAARWYYVLLKGLLDRGHAVTALASSSGTSPVDEVDRWFPRSEVNLSVFPLDARPMLRGKVETFRRPHSYIFSRALRASFTARLREPFDVLHCEQQWGGWLAWSLPARTLLNVQYLYDIDLAGSGRRNLRETVRVAGERRLLRRFPTISAFTPRLVRRIRELAPAADVRCIPLCLDLSLYPFREHPGPTTAPTVGLIGSYTWGPSHAALRRLVLRLWPAIRDRVPGTRLQIVGYGARSALADLELSPDVQILDGVPDALPFFKNMNVMLYAPERGSGAKVKVLEAFALGTPVVTTADGAEGIEAVDGVHAGICDDDDGLVARAVSLLRDQSRAERQRRAARDLVERHCDQGAALDRVETAYETIARTHAIAAVSSPR